MLIQTIFYYPVKKRRLTSKRRIPTSSRAWRPSKALCIASRRVKQSELRLQRRPRRLHLTADGPATTAVMSSTAGRTCRHFVMPSSRSHWRTSSRPGPTSSLSISFELLLSYLVCLHVFSFFLLVISNYYLFFLHNILHCCKFTSWTMILIGLTIKILI